jgi:hypothetical protein
MILRSFQPEDEKTLREIHARFGYRWPFPDDLGGYQVLTDDSGRILMAAGWKLIPEVTMLCDPDKSLHPLVKVKGISMLHDSLHGIITASGHREAICEVAPELERTFGRHLQRHWNWNKGWKLFRLFDSEVA